MSVIGYENRLAEFPGLMGPPQEFVAPLCEGRITLQALSFALPSSASFRTAIKFLSYVADDYAAEVLIPREVSATLLLDDPSFLHILGYNLVSEGYLRMRRDLIQDRVIYPYDTADMAKSQRIAELSAISRVLKSPAPGSLDHIERSWWIVGYMDDAYDAFAAACSDYRSVKAELRQACQNYEEREYWMARESFVEREYARYGILRGRSASHLFFRAESDFRNVAAIAGIVLDQVCNVAAAISSATSGSIFSISRKAGGKWRMKARENLIGTLFPKESCSMSTDVSWVVSVRNEVIHERCFRSRFLLESGRIEHVEAPGGLAFLNKPCSVYTDLDVERIARTIDEVYGKFLAYTAGECRAFSPSSDYVA